MEIFIIIITAFFFFYFFYKEGKNTDNYIKNRLKELSKITIMDNNEIKLLNQYIKMYEDDIKYHDDGAKITMSSYTDEVINLLITYTDGGLEELILSRNDFQQILK